MKYLFVLLPLMGCTNSPAKNLDPNILYGEKITVLDNFFGKICCVTLAKVKEQALDLTVYGFRCIDTKHIERFLTLEIKELKFERGCQ